MDVQWPDWRGDVLNALDVLASEPLELQGDEPDPRWPDLTNAIHWLVDDTWWDHHDPRESIGLILRDEREATAVHEIVQAIVELSSRLGATAPDRLWLGDESWPRVRALAECAARELRRAP
jgi:hypothetical protein